MNFPKHLLYDAEYVIMNLLIGICLWFTATCLGCAKVKENLSFPPLAFLLLSFFFIEAAGEGKSARWKQHAKSFKYHHILPVQTVADLIWHTRYIGFVFCSRSLARKAGRNKLTMQPQRPVLPPMQWLSVNHNQGCWEHWYEHDCLLDLTLIEHLAYVQVEPLIGLPWGCLAVWCPTWTVCWLTLHLRSSPL